jgi:hypothetical protein
LVMAGSAFSIGLVFLIFTQTMQLHATQNIFTGSFVAVSNITIAMIVNKFMNSLHFIFFISAILMLVSIVPSIMKWTYVKKKSKY